LVVNLVAPPEPQTVQRPRREVRPNQLLRDFALMAIEPKTYTEATSGSPEEVAKWKQSMQSELDSLSSKKVFEYAVHHTSRPIRTKWVHMIKLHADGRISRYKSRLVALGYVQILGVDYGDTFSPTVRIDSVRLIIAIANQNGWNLVQIDYQHGLSKCRPR
jgi:hypothetical protein